MIRALPPLLAAACLAASCSAPAKEAAENDAASAENAGGASSAAPAAEGGGSNASAGVNGGRSGDPSITGATPYRSADGLVRLTYVPPLKPGNDFGGKSLVTGGWRLMWDGKDPGPGTGVVSFAEDAKPTTGVGTVTEILRVGMSRDPGVVAHCGTDGMQGPNTRRLPNRMMGGHRWTVWQNGDAGMSQEIGATDLRTVVDGVCYAVDRFSYSVSAADAKPGLPDQTTVAARMDAVTQSIHVGSDHAGGR